MTLTREPWRKKNLAWYAWDFGTQLLLVNASVYFSLWLVNDQGVSDAWYSFAFIVSTILLIFLSPYAGVLLDRRGGRLKVFTILTALTLVAGALIEVTGGAHNMLVRIGGALACFALLNIFFQLASFIYNTFLKDISSESGIGRVSGIGAGASTLGDAAGLLVTLPIILGSVVIFGTSRLSVFIPAAVLGAVFALPMCAVFRGVPDERRQEGTRGTFRQIWRDVRDTRRYPGVSRFLLAYCFYNDAILTLQLYAALYLERVFAVTSSGLVAIIMLVYMAVSVGAFLGGYAGDALGYKRGLVGGLLLTAAATMLIAFGNPGPAVYALFALFGFGTGVTNANSKALFSHLIPYEKKGEFFGLYSIFERFASVLGPAAWSLVTFFGPSSGNLNYRLAVATMGFFLLLGAWTARKLKEVYTKEVLTSNTIL